ncbi:transposase, partial [Pseudomonas aeruginosa]
YTKTVNSGYGAVEVTVPRDRAGTFTPQMVPKGSRRLTELDDMIVSLYAGGMTVRDIQHHLGSILGVDMSPDTISTITDAVLDEVMLW